jgi:transposase-like protein
MFATTFLRRWVRELGPQFARQLRPDVRTRAINGDVDEMVVTISGKAVAVASGG